jgi:glycosyltransferase involved in cell wall biosynthesis
VYSVLHPARILNYQMELYVGDKLDTRAARLFKSLERRAAQRSSLTIEHDVERCDLLVEDLGLERCRVVIVPNAPIGPAHACPSVLLHRRLDLAEETRLLLCPGTMGEAFATETVVRAAQSLPDGWRCVVHSAQPRGTDDPYLQLLRDVDTSGRVTFSLAPVPYERIDELLGSARIGIALYSADSGANYSTVGLASGKLTHFLKLGVPVIVSPLPGLADFVRRNGVGEVLETPDALGEIVARIERDWGRYHENALRCFDAHLSYERAFEPVIAAVDKWLRPDPAKRGNV